MVVIGGVGSLPGAILGAAVVVGLPEYLRVIGDYRMLVFGAILIATMLFGEGGPRRAVRGDGTAASRMAGADRAEARAKRTRARDERSDRGPGMAPGGARRDPAVRGLVAVDRVDLAVRRAPYTA